MFLLRLTHCKCNVNIHSCCTRHKSSRSWLHMLVNIVAELMLTSYQILTNQHANVESSVPAT